MPTAPVSRNIITPLPYYAFYSWTPVVSTFHIVNGKVDSESRPASNSIPYVNGVRKCGDWNHSGAKWNKGSGSLWLGNPSANNAKYVGCIDESSFPLPLDPSANLINKGLTQALNKLKNQDIHLGTFVAEGRQTVGMIAQNAARIAKSIRDFRRKFPNLWQEVTRRQSRPNRNRRRCDIPGKWLELQYGWLPLMSDIHGAIKHLSKGDKRPLVSVKSSVENEDVVSRDSSLIGYVGIRRKYIHKQVVKTYLHYGLASDPLAELSSLGLINPVEIAWELLPYSFVVDWFLPIGPWISALTADVGYSFITGGQSRVSTVKPFGSAEVRTKPPDLLAMTMPSLSGMGYKFVRHCYSNTPVPGIYVKNPISTLHVMNAIALIAQAFRRK
jgi:hypothetical protein